MININPKYKDVALYFDEPSHSYTDNFGNKYISTTQILHRYVPKFDEKRWLKIKAKELGITEQELKEQWKTITKNACDNGNKHHNALEDSIKGCSKFKEAIQYLDRKNDGRMVTVADLDTINIGYKALSIKDFIELTENRYPEIYNVFGWYVARGYKIYSEIGFFLLEYLISGTIDILLVRDDGDYVIGDWKTNRGGLLFESGYFRKDKTTKPAQTTNEWVSKDERLLSPVNNLQNCNGNIYNLQVSLYAFAVRYITGMNLRGLWLCHIDSDFELNHYGQPKRFPDGLYHIKENPVERTTFYKMKFLEAEIVRVLADRKAELGASKVKQQFELGL